MRTISLKIEEKELVIRLKQKDTFAFSILYESYKSVLYGIIMKIVKTDPPASDVIQDAFLKIWNKIEHYDASKGSLFTWLLNITRNTGIDRIRSEEYKRTTGSFDISSPALNLSETTFSMFNPENIGIKEIVNKLKPEQTQIIDLIYFQGFSQAEVAEALNIPLGTVKTRVRAAITHLRTVF